MDDKIKLIERIIDWAMKDDSPFTTEEYEALVDLYQEMQNTEDKRPGEYREEIRRLEMGLSIIEDAPGSLSRYEDVSHVAICRDIAKETLNGCLLRVHANGTIVCQHVPEGQDDEKNPFSSYKQKPVTPAGPKTYYAVFLQGPGDAAYDVLAEELGRMGFAAGQDNGWSCYAVDSADKVPALEKALPDHEVVEMTRANFALWSAVFGEFSDDGIARWYELASGF